jgi:hypothetical protein
MDICMKPHDGCSNKMPRVRFIYDPTTGDAKWQNPDNMKELPIHEAYFKFNDLHKEMVVIETSRGIVCLNMHAKKEEKPKRPENDYVCEIWEGSIRLKAYPKEEKKANKMKDCVYYYLYAWLMDTKTQILLPREIMGYIWVRHKFVKPKRSEGYNFSFHLDEPPEYYDPITKTWTNSCDTIYNNIVKWVLSQMDKAQPDEEFYKQERQSVEKTFGEIEKTVAN